MKDELGTRMKSYEKKDNIIFKDDLNNYPIMCRIDGRNFSKYTKEHIKPFDKDLHEVFCKVTEKLIEETGADLGYTQSDEITLLWNRSNEESNLWFGG